MRAVVVATTLAVALTSGACSGGDVGGGGGETADGPGVTGATTGPRGGGDGDGGRTGGAGPLTVDTGVSDDAPAAGETVTVYCPVDGAPAGAPEPATSWSFLAQPNPLPFEAVVDGDQITFLTAGTYHLICRLSATGWTDPTPAVVHVGPGPAYEVDTEVVPDTLMAGQTAAVLCTGHDGWNNPVSSEWEVYTHGAGPDPGPDGGLVSVNQTVTGVVMGSYDVTCAHKSGKLDPAPARVTVGTGLPEKLITTLSHPVIKAGQASAVTCRAEDGYGNEVEDLPMSVDIPQVLGFQGFAVTGTLSGLYTITCVPVALQWADFSLVPAILEIQPAHAISFALKVVPPKPWFGVGEVMQLVVDAADQYGNPIVDATLAPLEIVPSGAEELYEGLALAFVEEGVYDITASLATNPALFDTVTVAVEGAPPALNVVFPKRGAALVGSKPSVTVEGTAIDAVAGITQVLVNDQPANLDDDGTWTAPIVVKWGLNVLHVVAHDATGQTDELTQSFYFAEQYHPASGNAAYIPDGMLQYLSEQTVDDDIHTWGDPDDMATVLEQVLLMLNTLTLAPEPLEIGLGYELKIWNIWTSAPTLQLSPRDGGIDVEVVYSLWTMSAALENDCGDFFIDICPDVKGTMSVHDVETTGVLWAAATDGELVVELADVEASVGFIDLSIDGLGLVLDILGYSSWKWLIDIIIDIIANLFAGTIEGQLAGGLGDALETQFIQLLEDMTVHESYLTQPLLPGLGTASFQFDTELDSLAFSPDGGRVGFGARILSPGKVFQQNEIPGSIGRGTCLKGYPLGFDLPGIHDFESAYRDDVSNGILHAVWRNGALNGALTPVAFPIAMGQGLLAIDDHPVTDFQLETLLSLPPILNACKDEDLTLIQVGDMYLGGTVTSTAFPGGSALIGAYLSFELTAGIALTDSDWQDTVGLLLGQLVDVRYHWEVLPEGYAEDPEPLEHLIEELFMKGLLWQALAPLGNFPVHGLGFAESVPGVTMAPQIDVLFRDNGHTATQGQLP